MKKISVVMFIVLLFSSASFAVGPGIGVRGMAMGGTGIASSNDITSAYYNPAGMMFGPSNCEVKAVGGGAVGGLQDMIDALSDTKTFLEKNSDKDISLSGSLTGDLGLSWQKVGLSMFATGNAIFDKPIETLTSSKLFNMSANVNAAAPLTLGSTFSTPGLPIAMLAVAVNLKSLVSESMVASVHPLGLTSGEGTIATTMGSGFGFDIGAEAKITPLITVGAVIRNLSASMSDVNEVQNITVDNDGTVNKGTKTKSTNNVTVAPEVGAGAAVMVPITGTLLALDMENYSYPDEKKPEVKDTYTDTHFGIEQGLLMNLIMLRAGYFTYGPDSDTYLTYGLGINIVGGNIGLAAVNSQNDFHKSQAVAELGYAF